jgi:hypothetical protein
MKASTFKALTSSAAFFALCASAVACNDSGSATYPVYPNQPPATAAPLLGPNSTAPVTTLSPTAAVARAAALKAAAAKLKTGLPQGRVSVVSSTSSATSGNSDTSGVPAARVRVVPAGTSNSKPVSTARVSVVSATEASTVAPPTPAKPVADDLTKSLDTLNTVKDDSSKLPDALKDLAGDWMAVSRQGDGGLSTVELQMDDHGWAQLTIPGADGKPSTTTRKVEMKDDQLTLTNKSGAVTLGKLVSADSRQLVLERESGQVTFVRP